MLSIVLATHDCNKAAEIQAMFQKHWHCRILTLDEVGFTDNILETGETLSANAEIQARTVRQFLNRTRLPYLALGESSGLSVEALGGRPGVRTACYGGRGCDEQAKRDLLRKELIGKERRTACYQCAMMVSSPTGMMVSTIGLTRGGIIDEERGTNGTDFDSIFLSYELDKTLAEATLEERDRVSHRRRALDKIIECLIQNPELATQLCTP